jgi:hypothetical protein
VGYCSAVTRDGWRWIVDAHRGDGKRYIVHSDELLSAFLELEAMLLVIGQALRKPIAALLPPVAARTQKKVERGVQFLVFPICAFAKLKRMGQDFVYETLFIHHQHRHRNLHAASARI